MQVTGFEPAIFCIEGLLQASIIYIKLINFRKSKTHKNFNRTKVGKLPVYSLYKVYLKPLNNDLHHLSSYLHLKENENHHQFFYLIQEMMVCCNES